MTRRTLCAFLAPTLLCLVGVADRAEAKPPDLPVQYEEVVTPVQGPGEPQDVTEPCYPGCISEPCVEAVAPVQVQPASACPCPMKATLEHLRPTTRRSLVGMVLFSVHPLLALAPLNSALDFPCDHPAPCPADHTSVATQIKQGGPSPLCQDPPRDRRILRALSRVKRGVPHIYEESRDGIQIVKELVADQVDPPRFFPLVGPARLHHCRWKCTVYYTQTIKSAYPFPFRSVKPRVEVVYIDLDHLHACAHPDQKAEPVARKCEPACQEKPSTCPWQPFTERVPGQARDRHAVQFADPCMTRSVLENLARLRKAHAVFRKGQQLAKAGRICEAMECFVGAQNLCPGRFEERVATVMAGMFNKTGGEEEEAEAPAKSCCSGSGCPCAKMVKHWLGITWPARESGSEDCIEQACPGSHTVVGPIKDTEKVEAPKKSCCSDCGSCPCCDKAARTVSPGISLAKSAVKKRLKVKVCVAYDDVSIRQVIEDVEALAGITVDWNGIEPDHKVSLQAEEVPLKKVLRKALGQAGLAYAIEQGKVKVVPTQPRLKTVVYPLGQLLHVDPARVSDRETTPRQRNLCQALRCTLTVQIDPRSWKGMGGLGSIEVAPHGGALVITQTESNHRLIAHYLNNVGQLLHLTPGVEETSSYPETYEEMDEEAFPRCKEMHEKLAIKLQVDGLMKACRLEMKCGRQAQAAQLAREAYALDPVRVAADPLVYKMHLLEYVPGSEADCEPDIPTTSCGTPATCPGENCCPDQQGCKPCVADSTCSGACQESEAEQGEVSQPSADPHSMTCPRGCPYYTGRSCPRCVEVETRESKESKSCEEEAESKEGSDDSSLQSLLKTSTPPGKKVGEMEVTLNSSSDWGILGLHDFWPRDKRMVEVEVDLTWKGLRFFGHVSVGPNKVHLRYDRNGTTLWVTPHEANASW
jgi:hypothetical protein